MEPIFKEPLSHFYIIYGGSDYSRDIIKKNIHAIYSKCIYNEIREDITALKARALVQEVSMRNKQSTPRVVAIHTNTITQQAQNILLKSCESPSPHTIIILHVPHGEQLLPTLLSRATVVAIHSESLPHKDKAKTFLKASLEERNKKLSSFVNVDDKEDTQHFINALESIIATEKDIHKKAAYYNTIRQVKEYINDTSVSTKQLFRYLITSLS